MVSRERYDEDGNRMELRTVLAKLPNGAEIHVEAWVPVDEDGNPIEDVEEENESE